jgi:uncharacterized SAM-binding protein YcdF (DUF218 family)
MRHRAVRRALRALLWVSLLGWIGLAGLLVLVPYAAMRLDRSDIPAHADYIVVLGGSMGRVAAGAQFYHYGFAPRVIFSCKEESAHVMAVLGSALGIPKEACLVDDGPKRGTLDHPKGISHLLGEEKVRTASFLVVTDWYHTRRAKATFAKAGWPRVRVCKPTWQRRPTVSGFTWRERWEGLSLVYHEWIALLVGRY